MDKLSKIAFIGLGAMGLPMSETLAKKLSSSKIYVFDIVQERTKRLHDAYPDQIVSCSSSIEAASQASIVLTMVPEGKHVRDLYLDPDTGLLTIDLSDKLLVDCSTIDPATSVAVKHAIHERYPEAKFYDAPVSGGTIGAANGTLTIMLGCSRSDPSLTLLQRLLGLMGSNVTPCGGHSLGLTAKLCNNYCSGLIALATAETFNVAIRAGLDPRVLHDIFKSSTAGSCINDKWNPVPGILDGVPSSNGYKPGFKIELMAKDFGLAVDVAREAGAKLVLAETGLQTYLDACKDEMCQGLDSRVVYRWLGGVEDWEGSFTKDERT